MDGTSDLAWRWLVHGLEAAVRQHNKQVSANQMGDVISSGHHNWYAFQARQTNKQTNKKTNRSTLPSLKVPAFTTLSQLKHTVWENSKHTELCILNNLF